jgi:hypothetical protein
VTKFLESKDDVTVRDYLRDWIALMAQGQFEVAHGWLYRGEGFTPEDLREWIFSYRPEYRAAKESKRNSVAPKISDPRALDLSGERFMMDVLEKPDENSHEVSGVEYFIPLDGDWSPMRASFFLREVGDRRYGLELTDISMV